MATFKEALHTAICRPSSLNGLWLHRDAGIDASHLHLCLISFALSGLFASEWNSTLDNVFRSFNAARHKIMRQLEQTSKDVFTFRNGRR